MKYEYEDGDWVRDYIYGAKGEVIYMQIPQTTEMNDAFDNFIGFIEAWLCNPYCDSNDLAWDYDDNNDINFTDWAMAVDANDFDGAFTTNGRYILTDFRNSVIGVVGLDGSVTKIGYSAFGTPSYTGDLDGLSVLWNGYYFVDETGNYYLRNRYYSPLERRFLTDDPRGINPDGNWNNSFAPIIQLADGCGLGVYAQGDPVNGRDDWGLDTCFCTNCPAGFLDPLPSEGKNGGWGWKRAALHYMGRSGSPVEFKHTSSFANKIANSNGNYSWPPLKRKILDKAKNWCSMSGSYQCNTFSFGGISPEGYLFEDGDLRWVINTGRNDAWSTMKHTVKCCVEKKCSKIRIKCRVRFDLRDTYSFDGLENPPIMRAIGVKFDHIVHFDKTLEENFICPKK